MVTNYQRGRRFEYRVRDWFREHGFFVVRSAGSKSPVDLVCVRSDGAGGYVTVFVQCKYGSSMMSKKELESLAMLCNEMGICGYIALCDKNGHIYFRYADDMSDCEAEMYGIEEEKEE